MAISENAKQPFIEMKGASMSLTIANIYINLKTYVANKKSQKQARFDVCEFGSSRAFAWFQFMN